MRIFYFLMLTGFCFSTSNMFAQDTLPAFTVKNSKGKISICWQNGYTKEIKGISIQRSYDSIKNFSSVTTIATPDDIVNGFLDINAPYTKMYYRLFIAFDSGTYIFTESQRPDVDPGFNLTNAIRKIRAENEASIASTNPTGKSTNQTSPSKKTNKGTAKQNAKNDEGTDVESKEEKVEPVPKKEEPPYPSRRIYTAKESNIVINLPDFTAGKYTVRFYDADLKPLFVLDKISEGYFIVEKVNFFHAGWFFFEIYEGDVLLEKNKFFIAKD